jgi:hypothetical protein
MQPSLIGWERAAGGCEARGIQPAGRRLLVCDGALRGHPPPRRPDANDACLASFSPPARPPARPPSLAAQLTRMLLLAIAARGARGALRWLGVPGGGVGRRSSRRPSSSASRDARLPHQPHEQLLVTNTQLPSNLCRLDRAPRGLACGSLRGGARLARPPEWSPAASQATSPVHARATLGVGGTRRARHHRGGSVGSSQRCLWDRGPQVL